MIIWLNPLLLFPDGIPQPAGSRKRLQVLNCILAQRDTDPTVAALILSLESVFAVIGGAIMLHERMSPRELIGCLVMFVAIILVQIPLPEKKEKKANS